MSDKLKELIDMLNTALSMEQAATIQYLSHAESIDGLAGDTVIARLQELAGDETGHAAKLRTLIGDYLDGVPTMGIAPTQGGGSIEAILKTSLKDEKEAVDFYAKILAKISDCKGELAYAHATLDHDIRHIMMDEQEHIAELRRLLGYSREQMLKH